MSRLDEFMRQAEAFRRERDRVVAGRREKLKGLPCEIPGQLFDAGGGLPRYPWAWYRGQLVVLRPSADVAFPNCLGGTETSPWKGLAKGCKPYLLLDLSPAALSLGIPGTSPIHARLPLFHPFKCSERPEMLYRVEAGGGLVATKSPAGSRSDRDWPYEGYPEVLPRQGLAVDGPYPVPFLALFPSIQSQVFSVQDLPDDGDQFLIVMVTADEETLGMSLLGSDAEAEGVQIAFLVSPDTGAVWTYNQCR